MAAGIAFYAETAVLATFCTKNLSQLLKTSQNTNAHSPFVARGLPYSALNVSILVES